MAASTPNATSFVTDCTAGTPAGETPFEFVERKGLGHPDTISDLLAEAMSQALCSLYLAETGRVLHYNIENALLVAGTSSPAFGAGRLERPLQFIFGDTATMLVDRKPLPVAETLEETAKSWFRDYLPEVDPDRDVRLRNELHAGSVQLASLFESDRLGANDTCVGTGYAPLSETERLVLAAEEYLNSSAFQERHPEAGQDVKVTGVRNGRTLTLVVSLAFVGAHVPSEGAYFEFKAVIADELRSFVAGQTERIDELDVAVNTLDREGRGCDGVYVTVLGTSADSADGGSVGRGNRPTGVNALARPLATGAVAGKNPVSNVGKIYPLFATELAATLEREVDGVAEVYVSLCAAIGRPLEQPVLASIRALPQRGVDGRDLDPELRRIAQEELSEIGRFVERIVREPPRVC